MSVFVWLLLGVEDTVEVKQKGTKGQKNEENNKKNRFARRCSIVTCPVSSAQEGAHCLKDQLSVIQSTSPAEEH